MQQPLDPDEHVPAADAQEQRRPLVDEGLDPEQTAQWPAPDGTSAETDPADAQDQTTEVGDDPDDEIVAP